ncbi:hypothetical protein BRC81_05010 [Halobacteriales archaeon QS_1_68_20]|nr:MAG: hypothetical protein BRC81_05010 [Halobacteriales archaeon QS_1_68_20]
MHSRRAFLAGVGAAVGSTAGCLDSLRGSSNGDDDTLRLVMAPGEFQGVVVDHIGGKNGVLQEKLDEVGYDLELEMTWDDVTLFASDGHDVGSMNAVEAAQLGAERDRELAVFGRAGDVPPYSLIASRNDLSFGDSGGDFEVVTADYFALGDLTVDGEVDVASTGPLLGIVDQARGGELANAFYISDYLAEQGFSIPSLAMWVCPQSYLEDHRPAVEALLEAYQEGVDWLYDNPYDASKQEDYMEMLGVENESQAEWLVDWGLKTTKSLDTPVMWKDVGLPDSYIQGQESYLDRAAEHDVAPSDWDDHLSFHSL